MTLRFSDKLRYLRQRHQMTQADLARRLSSGTRFHINNIEAGRKQPSIDFALQIATFFGVSLDYLLRDTIPVELLHSSESHIQSVVSKETRLALGRKVYLLRVQSGRSQTELARELGLQTRTHISMLENGQSDISLALVIKLAEIFDVSIDYLIRDSLPVADSRDMPDSEGL